MTEFVTVAIFYLPHEITVLKSILESEGISHFFQNENLISVDPLASLAFGGIKLKVHPNDVSEVKEIIHDLNTQLNIIK